MLDVDPNEWQRTLLLRQVHITEHRGVFENTTRSYCTTHVKQQVDAITPISFAAGESRFTLRETSVSVHRAFNT